MCHICCNYIQSRIARNSKRKIGKENQEEARITNSIEDRKATRFCRNVTGDEENQEEARVTKSIEDRKVDRFCPHSEDSTKICDFCLMAYKKYDEFMVKINSK